MALLSQSGKSQKNTLPSLPRQVVGNFKTFHPRCEL